MNPITSPLAKEGTFTMRRWLGIAVGLLVQVLFVVASYYNLTFLLGCPPQAGKWSVAWDTVLALQFSVVHSVLLLPAVRQRLQRYISPAFYGLFFCTATCVTLLFTISQWQVGDWALWQLTGWPRLAVHSLYMSCWGTLFYSLCCSGFGYHTGWLPWWYWVKQVPVPRRPFKPRGAFAVMRHPGYLSFLGLIWITPDMTIDRALLVGIWTVYIFLGSCLKDARLIHYMGDTYREYRARVTGYPGMFFGPLGKVRFPAPAVVQADREETALVGSRS
jgi:protein-S-isoprenylcysteine O-methyltransferase Ste14